MKADKEILVKVEGVSKKFCKDLKTSLWYGMKDLMIGVTGNKKDRELRPKEFWAVKDVSFELRRGECLGLIGHNGAGKSTLLKMLNGLINPDEGKITMKGRVGALIELGAGFNPILTGRENIYNNGAVLGFTRKEIEAKLEEIIAFSELEEFIDMPVQNYSSGMKVRLGFAVAAQMEPDVLLIDEVLAVGDLGFVLKCFKSMDQLIPKTAVIFVSHNMPMVSRICNQIILLEKGEPKYGGADVSKGIDLYYNRFLMSDSSVVFNDGTIESLELKISTDNDIGGVPLIKWGEILNLELTAKMNSSTIDLEFFIIIMDKEQRPIASLLKNDDKLVVNENGVLAFTANVDRLELSKGMYSFNVACRNRLTKEPVYRVNGLAEFQVLHEQETWEPFLLQTTFTQI